MSRVDEPLECSVVEIKSALVDERSVESPPVGFTFAEYRASLRAFRAEGYAITGFLPFLEAPKPKHMILRHDVDHSLEQALRLARIDAAEGCSATFFLRVHARGYNVASYQSLQLIDELHSLGHEVELHLDGGIHQGLPISEVDALDRQREVLEAVLRRPINGFSAHEPARMGNLDSSDDALTRWGVRYHAYQARFMNPQIRYLSDSSARWRDGHFFEWLGRADHLHVLVHPVWWYDRLPQENV